MSHRAGAWIKKPTALSLIVACLLLLFFGGNPKVNALAAGAWFIELHVRQPDEILNSASSPAISAGQTATVTNPHGNYTALTNGCAVCHRGHTAAGRDLTTFWLEEDLCFSCHSAEGSAAADMSALFQAFPNSDTAYYAHPIMDVSGVHDTPILDEFEDHSDRHVECADCHNPHFATIQDMTPPAIPGSLVGVTGVEPDYDGPGPPLGFTRLSLAQFEYQICFQCHSNYTDLPDYLPDGWSGSQLVPDGLSKLTNQELEQVPDSRDLAQEFNPAQGSYHPVLSPGRNLLIPPESFVDGWSVNSYVYCSDCHSTQVEIYTSGGPHAGQLHILKETSPYITVNFGERSLLTGLEVCFNCHRVETYLTGGDPAEYTNFRRNAKNLHRTHANNASCYQCHDSHGSEQRHLLNLDTSLNNLNSGLLVLLTGYDQQLTNSQSFWQISPDGGTKTCFINCHNHNHDRPGWTYPNYVGE